MGLFDFGGSRSESRSESESSSFDNLDQFGFSFGQSGSTSSSRGSSVSGGSSRSGSRTRQDIAFQDVFSNLFRGAGSAAGRVDPGRISDAASLLFSSGSGFLDTLGQGGAGARFLEERLAGSDGLADDQVDLLRSDIAEFLAEDVNPAITRRGVAAGTLGGSRGEVQRGLATEAALEEFTRGAVGIRAAERASTDAIAQGLAADESGRMGAGLSALPALFGLAESGALAELSPFAALSSVIGGPTVLTSSDSQSSAEDFSRSLQQALAQSFGIDFAVDQTTGRAGSRSRSTSSSDSTSFSFGFN